MCPCIFFENYEENFKNSGPYFLKHLLHIMQLTNDVSPLILSTPGLSVVLASSPSIYCARGAELFLYKQECLIFKKEKQESNWTRMKGFPVVALSSVLL